MNTSTVSARIPAPSGDVFSYLSDIAITPEWATEFIDTFEQVNGRARITTARGAGEMRILADRATGCVDFQVTLDGQPPVTFPSRVFPLPDGATIVLFTVFQAPDQPDDAFATDLESLERELDNVRRHFEA